MTMMVGQRPLRPMGHHPLQVPMMNQLNSPQPDMVVALHPPLPRPSHRHLTELLVLIL